MSDNLIKIILWGSYNDLLCFPQSHLDGRKCHLILNYISLLHDFIITLSHVTQASGIAISDGVIEHYNSIRVRQAGTEAGQRLKLVVMCLSKDQKSIVVDEENCLKVKDVGNSDVLKKILSKLPTNECRYALYDCSYVSKESVKEDLVFILSYEAFCISLINLLLQSRDGLCSMWLFGCNENISSVNHAISMSSF